MHQTITDYSKCRDFSSIDKSINITPDIIMAEVQFSTLHFVFVKIMRELS